ncbi:tetratricopeptide repeat protein [Dysgonomonas sp. 25]|uniref:type IX secretion system periplasmic lipoprotein PorW/SprE n=1 Tax=Dysgonomonas sp. 25 TaxID=2302933 RepID=UPI0013D50C9D|nr:tetratricopeptide repeat protein [Dysgonomonas sp. 25]NDV67316.1 hypothetical protein [Dysgonomonas sp. 25]
MSCSNKKNTAVSRAYHSLNTRYNIYFNANEAYKEALQQKMETQEDNLSEQIYIYPYDPDAMDKILSDSLGSSFASSSEQQNEKGGGLLSSVSSSLFEGGQKSSGSSSYNTSSSGGGGSFTTTIDKATKAIKLHSITTKPRRERSKMKNEEYRAWVQQKEFNPFMKNVWLLLGKAELQNGNYLRAISTFMYTRKIYPENIEMQAECQLWIACAYTEMGWMYEAGDVLTKLDKSGEIPESLRGLYSSVYANYLMRGDDYEKAIPHLQLAIKKEKNSYQKLRMKYMLGQLYEKTGDTANAYKAYGAVQGLNTPHKFGINARLSQLAIDNTRPVKKVISDLEKMTKTSKNENYLDRIYYTLGNVYLQQQDTVNAVANYHLAIKESKSSGYDKTLAQIRLGDLYFDLRKFVPAQPFYSGALSGLKKTDKDYPRVSKRSAVLDELVIHVKTVHEQDSLQHLASLPEAERMQIIEDKIAQIKKEEEEKKKEEEREQRMEEREQQISSWDDFDRVMFEEQQSATQKAPNLTQQQSANTSNFYFYNPQTVEQGKAAFKKQWGTRKLEDNWRRRNKETSGFDDMYANTEPEQPEGQEGAIVDPTLQPDNTQQATAGSGAEEQDIYNPQYYLQQLPFTEEAITQSNELIENGLFQMGGIYKTKLEDAELAIDAYETDLRRFPSTPNAEEIYYQLFLIYMQLDNRQMMAYYRDKLLSEYAGKNYAIALSDPNYEWNLKHMHSLQDSLYNATYEAYLDSDIQTVRGNYESLQSKYPFANLMPKFMFLNALTYAQTKDAGGLKTNLEKLVADYPDADVTPMAQGILDNIRDGRVLLSDGTPIRGMKWDIPYEGEDGEGIVDINQVQFADNLEVPYMLLLFYRANSIDRNELLYQVADYNFSNYIVQTFDLNFEQDLPLEMLQIKGFEQYANVRSYINKAFLPEGLAHKLDPSILMVPVSEENSRLLLRKGIDEYITFYKDAFVNQTPQLVAYWAGENSLVDAYTDEDLLADIPVTDDKKDLTSATPDKKPETTEPIRQPEREVVPREDIRSNVEKQQQERPVQNGQTPVSGQDGQYNTEIKASDIMSKDQIDLISSASDIAENPVDGLKGLFSKYKDNKKLTKEEKEELKEERRLQKEREKELKAIEKARQDSIQHVEKAVQDSIKQVERAKIEEQKRIEEEKARIEREKIEAQKAKEREREQARQQKETERKEKARQQEERRKNQDKEREERRKAQVKAQEEKRKAQEKARKEKEKEAKERRKRK